MKTPKINTQEILLTLIQQGYVSIMDYPYLSGFRTRISELVRKYGLNLYSHFKVGINKFGNTYTFTEHHLVDPEKALQLYNELTENN